MKQKKYARAEDVLPQELLEQVRQHFTGTLYISGKRTGGDANRSDLVIALAKQNAPTKEIAMIVGMSVRRVNQIIAGRRRPAVEWFG